MPPTCQGDTCEDGHIRIRPSGLLMCVINTINLQGRRLFHTGGLVSTGTGAKILRRNTPRPKVTFWQVKSCSKLPAVIVCWVLAVSERLYAWSRTIKWTNKTTMLYRCAGEDYQEATLPAVRARDRFLKRYRGESFELPTAHNSWCQLKHILL